MYKLSKKYTFYSILIVFIILGIYSLLTYYNFFQDTLTIINNHVYSKLLPSNTFQSTYDPKIKFADMPISKVDNITLNILDKYTIKNTPTLLKAQRYYIPLSLICEKLNYSIQKSESFLILANNSHKIILTENTFTKDSNEGSLRGNIIIEDDKPYISISDIEEIFDLIAVFDFKSTSISLIANNIEKPKSSLVSYSKKVAFLRFEDFTAGYSNMVDTNQTKIKCMTNFLYSKGIKFHIAWIPRFKVPLENIDNDLLQNNSIENVGFVNLLDYLINKGGEIGLHGYTHQSGDSNSAVGEELSKDINSTVEATRAVIENGIDTASALNIPISFYESPHYRDTKLQQSIIEEYFQILYEPYDSSKKNIYKTDNNHLYVPTPLGYVKGPNNEMSAIIDGLNNYDPEVLRSLFYHPSTEIDFIQFTIADDTLNVQYDENSPLQKIVRLIKDNKYTTLHISDLIDK